MFIFNTLVFVFFFGEYICNLLRVAKEVMRRVFLVEIAGAFTYHFLIWSIFNWLLCAIFADVDADKCFLIIT